MRAWLYYRLSRDEDEELNSLNNQRKILEDYALEKGFEIVGESFDDNVSGMHFNREGIDKIYEAVDNKLIDAIIVKDLSRLGRHRTQTALFIDHLTLHHVKVLSVTENIDTSNENDDLIIGFKSIINDFYSKDISRKIRAGFRQKQKDGIVMIPPMGYFKDKNTGEIVIIEESATIVKQIFDWYVNGYGLKAIAKKLNDSEIKSPSYYQKKYLNRSPGSNKPELSFRYLWEQSGVKRILQNEFYAGTLVCHKVEHNKIKKTRKQIPEENRFRHENFVPAIISKELWEKAKFLLDDKPKRNVRAGSNKPMKRYTGLIKCADCGCVFIGKNRSWNGKPYTEYVCNGYHRYGKDYCSTHAINDMTLDKIVYEELQTVKNQAGESLKTIEKDIAKWIADESSYKKKSNELEEKIRQIDIEIEKILMERIDDKENRSIYDGMLKKRREEKAACQQNIASMKNYDEIIKRRKAQMKKSVNLIDNILKDGGISDTHLRMLIENIVIKDGKDGLQIEIVINADFKMHTDYYDENGEILKKSFASIESAV